MKIKTCQVCKGTMMYNVPPKPCYRCKDGTIAEGWDEPENPPIDLIRALAREVGYAIGTHGSQLRDYDIMAFPWTEDAVSCEELVEHLCKGLLVNGEPAFVHSWEHKPLGRKAFTVKMQGWIRNIDLSVAPMVK